MPTDESIPTPRPPGMDGEPSEPFVRQRTPRPDVLIGKMLDERYRIVGLLARGGMGRVYRAEQAPLGRVVAVKVLDVGLEHGDDQEFRQRFIREAETCARLTHPNTVRVFDYGETSDDVLYIAMEYLNGRNLYQAIQTDSPMDSARVVRIGRQVASSLREAHALGLIHRDLKPSNIILTRPGGDEEFVKVVDFGLVKEIRAESELTRNDALVGSPSYMSPEQIRSAALDQRSDIYSFGVLLYACLTGRAPFTGTTSLNVLMGHLNHPPPPMDSVCPSMKGSPTLEAVVMRCLAKEPDDRYDDMDAVLQALQHCDEALRRGPAERVPVEPPPTTPPVAPPVPSPLPSPDELSLILPPRGPSARVVVGIGVSVLVGFALIVGGLAWRFQGPSEPSESRGPAPRAPAEVPPPSAVPAPEAAASTAPPEAPAPSPSPAGATPPPRAADPAFPALPPTSAASASRSAAPSDTPASATPAPGVPKEGSDVRDPWKEP